MRVHSAIFSGNCIDYTGEEFCGANYTAVFGGIQCDLSNAVFTESCKIKAVAVFGGMDFRIPRNVNVTIKEISVFGSVSNKYHRNFKENEITVTLECYCIFGGINIK